MNYLSPYKNGIRIQLHVQPRASKTRIIGEHGDALKIAIQAPPVDGEANDAIIQFFKKLFDRPARDIEILSGETGRKKSVFIANLTPEEALKKLLSVLEFKQK